MAHRPVEGSQIGNAGVDAAGLQAEIEALRQRLAAVEARLPGNASAAPERRHAIRQPRLRSKTDAAELEPDAAGRIARRRALGLGALASLFTFIGRSAARAADALTIGPNGVNIDNLSVAKSLTVAGNAELKTPIGANTLDVQSAVRVNEVNHPKGLALYVTATSDPDGKGVEFRHTNGSQGIGIGYNTIYATGSNTDQDLILKARGKSPVKIQSGLTVEKSLTVSGDAALSKSLTGSLLSVTAPGDPNDLNKVSHLRLIRDNSDKTGGKKVYLELYQDDPNNDVAEVYPCIRFHHNNNFWHRLEARSDGLHLKTGNIAADDYQKLTVGGLAAKGNLTVSDLSVPGGQEALRMLRGIVNFDGTKFGGGEGFTVKPVAANRGLYDITFTPGFPSIPAASATQIYGRANTGNEAATSEGGETTDNAVIAHLSADRMRVQNGGWWRQ
jgi:hypothetical protein